MSTSQKVHQDPVAPAPPAKLDPTEMMALFTLGVKRIAEVQKKGIDLAVQQNTELFDLWRKTFEKLPGATGVHMLELGNSGFGRYAEIQRAAIDLVVEQSQAFASLLKERTAAATQVTEDADNFRKRAVERVVALQKKVLEQSGAQARAVVEKSSEQFGIEGSTAKTAADSIQHGVDAIVDAQKELLDMALR